MITGIILFTHQPEPDVRGIMRKLGFTEGRFYFLHEDIAGIAAQVEETNFHGYNTVIEYNDLMNRFPKYPEAVTLLKELNRELPDLYFHAGTIGQYDPSPLETYLSTLKDQAKI